MEPSEGFPPLARDDARILILGSLPGARSIQEHEYYAHPQNGFWPIMSELFDINGPYEVRCQQLIETKIALWDVLHRSVRPGSLDADIQMQDAVANDFQGFLLEHSAVRLIAFNGKKAEQLFQRLVSVPGIVETIATAGLPSTSPAYASLRFSGKLAAWRRALVNDTQ